MTQILTPDDLAPFAEIDPAKAEAMIEDAVALAVRVAPCIAEYLDPSDLAVVRAILRNAILRWNETGAGALAGVTQQAGSFQVSQTLDTRQPRRALLQPDEINQLQRVCQESSRAFEIDTVPGSTWPHLRTCPAITGGPCRCGGVLIG